MYECVQCVETWGDAAANLCHEARDDAVELGALEVERDASASDTLLTGAKRVCVRVCVCVCVCE